MARVHTSDEVWAEFRRAAGNTPMSEILGRLVEREVERDRARRIRSGTVDDQVLLDALERARELRDDLAAIVERLRRRMSPPDAAGFMIEAGEPWSRGPRAATETYSPDRPER